jgi:hypothetical protein
VGVDDLHVVLEDVALFLDVGVVIDTLTVLPGASLSVTDSVDEDTGDLTITEPGGILNKGTIFVAYDRTINASSSQVTIGAGGVYRKHPSASGVSASLTADTVTILGGTCDPFVVPGEMELTNSMSVYTAGDFILDGRNTDPVCSGMVAGQSAALLGGQTPPVLSVGCLVAATASGNPTTASRSVDEMSASPAPALTVEGDFVIMHSATLAMLPSCTATAADAMSIKLPTLFLGGNFDNQSQSPSSFDWDSGRLTFIGTSPQTFEVAGQDFGRTPDGFDSGVGPNFSMGVVELRTSTDVTFVNNHFNTVGTGACTEALYVHELILRAGSSITIDNCGVYYDSLLVEDNVTVVQKGCGYLGTANAPEAAVPETIEDTSKQLQINAKNRFLSFTAGEAGVEQAIRVKLLSLPAPYNQFNGGILWVQAPFDVSEIAARTDTSPPTFKVATLGCSEVFRTDWETLGTVHAYSPFIVPGGNYVIQIVNQGNPLDVEGSFSTPLQLSTSDYGDVCSGPKNNYGEWSPPDESADITTDVLAVKQKFGNQPGLTKTRAELGGDRSDPWVDFVIDISKDVLYAKEAFTRRPYPFPPPPAESWPCVNPTARPWP